jgi:hypothetical protein
LRQEWTFVMLGGRAKFEGGQIPAWTATGNERTKALHVKLGSKPKLTPHQQR